MQRRLRVCCELPPRHSRGAASSSSTRRARLARHQRRAQRGVAAADDQDIDHWHSPAAPRLCRPARRAGRPPGGTGAPRLQAACLRPVRRGGAATASHRREQIVELLRRRRQRPARIRAPAPPCPSPTDSHFKHASLSVGKSVARVKRPFSVATGCWARLSWHLRAGTDARVAARGQAGAGTSRPGGAHRRAAAVVVTS